MTTHKLGPLDGGVRVSIGRPGSGKTFGVRRDVIESARAGMPIVVVDVTGEWTLPPGLAALNERGRIPSWADVRSAVAAIERGDRIAIVRTPIGAPAATLLQHADDACRWACNEKHELRGVAIPEAWLIAPASGRLSPGIAEVTRMWRHRNVALWLDAQRISMMSRNVVELAKELRLYAASGDTDFDVIRRVGGGGENGRQLAAAIATAAARFADGEPGWHVILGEVREPPFELVR